MKKTPQQATRDRMDRAAKPKRRLVGSTVYIYFVSADRCGNVLKAEVRERVVSEIYEDYCGHGLHYACCKREFLGQRGYGLSYPPDRLYDTEAEARIALRDKLRAKIDNLFKLLTPLI